jgi:hypothetical protein
MGKNDWLIDWPINVISLLHSITLSRPHLSSLSFIVSHISAFGAKCNSAALGCVAGLRAVDASFVLMLHCVCSEIQNCETELFLVEL